MWVEVVGFYRRGGGWFLYNKAGKGHTDEPDFKQVRRKEGRHVTVLEMTAAALVGVVGVWWAPMGISSFFCTGRRNWIKNT